MRVEPAGPAYRASALPRPTTPIVGRSEEVALLREHLARGTRLVTVAGLGGLGKTRIVLEAVQAVSAPGPGAPVLFWCDTSTLNTAEDLLWSLGVALGVELPPLGLQSDPWGTLASATAALPRHTIVLDALEGLASTVAAGLEAWLLRSPPTSLLVTSRHELATASEHVLALEPLPSGTLDSPATQLLLARARQVRPGWAQGDEASVAALAQRLDGWPLLIELVAAEARASSPRTLAQVLDAERSAPSTASGRATAAMQSILDRAWSMLSPRAARGLTRLAALDGTFDLELGAATLEVGPSEALDLLTELARHSLVTVQDGDDGAAVHRLLDTVRTHVLKRGDPDEIINARRLATQAILVRHAPTQDPAIGRQPPLPPRDLERLFALVERGARAAEPEALSAAFIAAHILLASFTKQRTTLAPIAACTRLVIESAGARSVPIETRLAVARQLARWELPWSTWEAVIAIVEDWLAEAEVSAPGMSPDDASSLLANREELRLQLELQHFAEWRYHKLLAMLESVPKEALVPGSFRLYRHGLFSALARRGLGLTDLGDGTEGADERLLAEIARSAASQAAGNRELDTLVNLAFLVGQLGRPHALTMARDFVARCRASGASRTYAYGLRELARIEVERGLIRSALGHYGETLADSAVLPRAITETALERAATLLEAARVEEAWGALSSMPTGEETSFSRAYGDALRWAVGWMLGRAIPSERWPMERGPTDTVEDHAIAILWAIGRPELEATLARASHAARFSTRVRQAVRIGEAVLGARRGMVLAVTLESGSFRLGANWQSLQSKPLLAALLDSLVNARLEDAERALTKDELGAILWPGDKAGAEQRDNRLHVAVSSLRRLGLGTMLVHDGRGFRLDPSRPLIRLVVSALD